MEDDSSVHSSSEIVDMANEIKENENLMATSSLARGLHDESTISVTSLGASNTDSEAKSEEHIVTHFAPNHNDNNIESDEIIQNDLGSDNNSDIVFDGQEETDLARNSNSEILLGGQEENDFAPNSNSEILIGGQEENDLAPNSKCEIAFVRQEDNDFAPNSKSEIVFDGQQNDFARNSNSEVLFDGQEDHALAPNSKSEIVFDGQQNDFAPNSNSEVLFDGQEDHALAPNIKSEIVFDGQEENVFAPNSNSEVLFDVQENDLAPNSNSESSSSGEVEHDLAQNSNSESPSSGEVEHDLARNSNSESPYSGEVEHDLAPNSNSEPPSSGEVEHDLNSESKKLTPVATSGELSDVSSPRSGGSVSPTTHLTEEEIQKIQIDTKKPFDSVKTAVSKFGGILDWKAHKVSTVEKCKVIDQELEKIQDEIPLHKEQAEIAERSKHQMLRDLQSMKRVIEGLKVDLESAQTEERQAKQDCQIAEQIVEDMEHGISQEGNKTQLEVATARYSSAVTDLKAVKDELDCLRTEYATLMAEKNDVEKKAEEAISSSKEMEESVEKLTEELISLKESVEYAKDTDLKDENERKAIVMDKEKDILSWDNELKKTEDDLEKLDKQIESAKDLKSKLETASSLLKELKAELVAYMDAKVNHERNGDKSDAGFDVAVAATYKELEQVKLSIEKATDEVNCLNEETTSLKAEVEMKRSELANAKERELVVSNTVSSLEGELAKIKSEIASIGRASEEADVAKSAASLAQGELNKAEEEVEESKAEVNALENRLLVAQKEMELAAAIRKSTLDTIEVLKAKEAAQTTDNHEESLNDEVTLSLDEYYEISKRIQEAEEEANKNRIDASSKLDIQKEYMSRSLKELEEVSQEVEKKKESLRVAQENAEKAKETKLALEQELSKCRAEQDLHKKGTELGHVSVNSPRKNTDKMQAMKARFHALSQVFKIDKVVETSSPKAEQNLEQPKAEGSSPSANGASPNAEGPSPKPDEQSPMAEGISPKGTLTQSNTINKKKKAYFPRFFMFFTRKKTKQ